MDDGASISLVEATSILRRAFFALVVGDLDALELFTEDVSGDSPVLYVRSRTELECQLLDRAGALSNVEFDLFRVEMNGPDSVVASWRVEGDHTGEVLFNEDVLFHPTGRRIRLVMTSEVEFRDRRITKFRTSFDDDLFGQLRDARAPSDERRRP